MSNGPSSGPVPPLVERLLVEQRQRWRRGDRVPVEAYLEQQPTLGDNAEAVLHFIFNEVVLREQDGEAPRLDEYQRRFPHLAAQLELQFALDRALAADLLAPPTVLAPTRRLTEDRPPTPAGPQSIPGYETLAELGRGGMGVVYQAWQTSLSRMVALKMILSGAHAGPDELARFRAEAEAVARLQHPNIVQIYEVGEHDGRPYFALEYVEGGSLERKLDGTPQPAREAAALAETLARAVHYAHQRGVVHRDLKPANVLLAQDGMPKITDFGLAKVLVGARSDQTRTGAILGTPSYMAPEQARGRAREIGPPTDVYALGAVLYEMLTGRPPFKATSAMETLEQVVLAEPLAPSRLQPQVPRDLETVCLKCLQKEPRKRYASAHDLADDLRRFLDGEPVRARPTPAWERALKWAKRRPMTAAVIAVSTAAALVVAFLGARWYRAELHTAQAEARAAQQDLQHYQDVEDMRVRAQKDVGAGEEALARKDWSAAQLALSNALAALGDEPSLAGLKAHVETALAEAEGGLKDQGAHQEFVALHDAVRFYSSQVTGLDLAANRAAIRRDAPKALALFGVTPDAGAAPVVNEAHFDPPAKADIVTGCYELLLLLADAVAHPLPSEKAQEQAAKALDLLDRAAALRPPTPGHDLLRARYVALLGNGPGAAPGRRPASESRPEPDGAVDYFLLGNERYQQRDLRQALAHFEAALRRDPGHFWARFMLAVCHLRSQHPAEAEAHLSACLSRKPEFTWTYLLQGFVHTELGALALAGTRDDRGASGGAHFRAAEDFFQQAWARERNAEASYVLLANRGVLRLRQAEAARAAGEFRAAAALFPGPFPAALAAAERVRQQKLADAGADFEEAIRLREKQYHAHLNLAKAYEEQDRLDAAVAELDGVLADRARAREPAPAAVYRARARLRAMRHEPAAALEDLRQAIDGEAREGGSRTLAAEDHRQRALLLANLGRYPEAVAACDEALKLRADFAAAHRLRAEVQGQLGHYGEAVASYDRYLERAERSLDEFLRQKEPVAAVYRERASAKRKLRQPRAALDDYTAALRLEPTSETYAFRGWVYLELNSPSLARADFDKAVGLDPNNGDAHAGRGYALVWAGEVDEALSAARRALELGRPQEALAAAAGNPQLAREKARLAYNVGRVYAQAAGKVELGPARLAYQARAVQLVRTALSLTPAAERPQFWREYVEADRALAPVRRSPEFSRLAAEYPRPAG